jgi:alkane 1-monooxygenase
LAFLVTGPHDSVSALAWTMPLWLMVAVDWLSPRITSRQSSKTPLLLQSKSYYFDAFVYALALLQIANITFMLIYASQLQWHSTEAVITSLINLVVLRIMVGTSSGSSGIIVAHELIHRSSKNLQRLGRLLMCTVCYEHFIIAHKQGHHQRVAKPEDIATAGNSESYEAYCKRVYLEHWLYSWHYEMQRLAIGDKPWQLQVFKNRVLQGVIVEILLVIAIIFIFGWIAATLFLYCAYAGVRLLEAINYFQHWGLSDQASSSIAWINDSWLTHYALLGMSSHVEHHEHADKHYQEIGFSELGPKMPYGYFVMNLWVKLGNRSYQKMANRELDRYTESTMV